MPLTTMQMSPMMLMVCSEPAAALLCTGEMGDIEGAAGWLGGAGLLGAGDAGGAGAMGAGDSGTGAGDSGTGAGDSGIGAGDSGTGATGTGAGAGAAEGTASGPWLSGFGGGT